MGQRGRPSSEPGEGYVTSNWMFPCRQESVDLCSQAGRRIYRLRLRLHDWHRMSTDTFLYFHITLTHIGFIGCVVLFLGRK